MWPKLKKVLLNVGQILLFIVCFLLAKYIANFSLYLDNPIIDPARLLLIFLFATIFYCAVFTAIAFAVKKGDSVRPMLKKNLINISQVSLFAFCMQLAAYVAMWYVCKILLKLTEVKFIDSPGIGLIMLPLVIIFYCAVIGVIKLTINMLRTFKK